MITYRPVFMLSGCWRRSFKASFLRQKNIKHPYSTHYISSIAFVRKTSKEVSSDLTWQHGVPQCISVRPTQTTSKDAVSEQLVYKGELRKNIKMLKILTLTTSIGGFSVQPIVLSNLWQTSPYFAYSIGIISTAFILLTPLLVHVFTRRYVTELYFNPETKTFTATTLTMLIRKKKTTFTADDVHVPTIPGFFTTFLVKNTPMFVDSESVINIEAYQHLMGYDKPIDFYFQKSTDEKKNVN